MGRPKKPILAACLVAVTLSGCSFSGFAIRDDYWGKAILEQALFQRGVTHDGLGAPVLATKDDLLIQPPGPPDPDVDEDPEP